MITPQEGVPDTSSHPSPNLRQRILLAENEADLRRLNAEVLTQSGYQVDTVEDGAAAWDALQLNRYDLLITSQHLPKTSGVELLRKMNDTSLHLPVIMTTRIMPTWEFALHPWLQPTTMVRTPYTIEELTAAIRKALPIIPHKGITHPSTAQKQG